MVEVHMIEHDFQLVEYVIHAVKYALLVNSVSVRLVRN